jgi:predicted HD superfamily hydrolase involved in NAD metabolism
MTNDASRNEFERLARQLKKTISSRRYQHCLAVADLAERLSNLHKLNLSDIKLAGLFHDCTKEWSPARLKSYVKRHSLRVPGFDFIVRTNPNLLHAYTGAHFAAQKGWIKTKSAQRAIASHTLARRNMTIAEKILYISDFASKDRTYRSARIVRRLAMTDLNGAFRLALAKKIKWNLTASKPIHSHSLQVWNSVTR